MQDKKRRRQEEESDSDSGSDSESEAEQQKLENKKKQPSSKKQATKESDSDSDSDDSSDDETENALFRPATVNGDGDDDDEEDSADEAEEEEEEEEEPVKKEEPKPTKAKAPKKEKAKSEEEIALGKQLEDEVARKTEATVYIEGIPYKADEGDIVSHFAPCGIVKEVRMPRYQDSGKPRGYAHVVFEDKSSIAKALKLDGKYLFWSVLDREGRRAATHVGECDPGTEERQEGREGLQDCVHQALALRHGGASDSRGAGELRYGRERASAAVEPHQEDEGLWLRGVCLRGRSRRGGQAQRHEDWRPHGDHQSRDRRQCAQGELPYDRRPLLAKGRRGQVVACDETHGEKQEADQ